MTARHRGRQGQTGDSSCRRHPALVAYLGMASSSSSKQRRRRTTQRGHGMAAGLLLLWAGGVTVSGQLTDGGDISMSCNDCDCSGSSDVGTVTVFENPSNGGQVALVEGELTEVVETSCGKSVIAVGTTIFELSGVDLGSREVEVVDLSSGDCTVSSAPSNADCYSGTTSHDLSGSVKLDLTFCLCSYTNDSGGSQWNVNVKAAVSGASEVSIPNSGLGICPDNGYISQLVTAEVDGETYLYNFDLAQPGEDSSADLSVGSGPSSDAQAFICGEETEVEPEPEEGEEEQVATPAPIPVPEETEEEEEEVVKEETPAPMSPEPEGGPETPSPLGLETSLPAEPTATTSSATENSSAPSASPDAAADVGTPAPGDGTRGLETPAPAETLAPLTEAELEQVACSFPVEDPCTPTTPVANITRGLGAYYDPTCSGAGCGVGSSELCRTCYFDTLLFKEQEQLGEGDGGEVLMPDYAPCPCCVLAVYGQAYAQDEDGQRCVNATPAPTTTALDTEARGFESLGFKDNPLTLAGGEAIALGALGLFAVTTFLPFCTK